MAKHRDRLNIIADVLEGVGKEYSKTSIKNLTRLSSGVLEKYLDVALRVGLIQSFGLAYKLTGNGRGFLRMYKEFRQRQLHAQKLLEDLQCERDELVLLCKN